MRFKFYLRGAGFGILIATVVLIISLRLHGNDAAGGQADAPAAESETITAETQSAAGDEAAEEEMEGRRSEASSDGPSSGGSTEDADGENVIVTVERGDVCRTIAEDLAEKGLVADAEEFRLYMDQNGYDSGIHVGEFEIPIGASYEEIAKILAE